MEILVQNKQRQYKIDQAKTEAMAHKLAQALFVHFRKNKPRTKWASSLEDIDKSAVLSLLIVSSNTIKRLNKEWRAKDKETDVLSFPLLDFSSPQISQELHSAKNPSGSQFDLGEIFISYEQAIKQAKEYKQRYTLNLWVCGWRRRSDKRNAGIIKKIEEWPARLSPGENRKSRGLF